MPAQAPATTTDLLALLRKSGVLPPDPPDLSGLPPDPVHAATALVNRGVLTKFQARMLLAGKVRGFRLGDYVIRDQIGQGGMGAVYLGVHQTLGRKVAIKVLPAASATDQLALERFRREARTAAALDHPNVVKLYDVARDGEVWYLVMEYVEGRTLAQVIQTGGGISATRAVGYVAQAAAGLQHAHEKGFIHRDVKPANLMLALDGTVKILDMGLARSVGPDPSLTDSLDGGAVVGTADYVSPEQVLNDPDIDIRADIYSLGLTFYALVTGRPPFAGSTAGKLVQQQLKDLPSLSQLDKTFPPKLARVIGKMVAKRPDERYRTPADVIAALQPWLDETPQVVAGVSRTMAAHRLSSRRLRAGAMPERAKARGVPLWVWAAGGGLLLAVLAGGTAVAVAMMGAPAAKSTREPPLTQEKTPPTNPAVTPATTSVKPRAKEWADGPVIYSADLLDLKPFEQVLAGEPSGTDPSKTVTVEKSKTGPGTWPKDWSVTTWAKGNEVRGFAEAGGGLGVRAVKGVGILFAPVQELGGKVAAVRVTFEYRSTAADKKMNLRVREMGVQPPAQTTDDRPLSPAADWTAADFVFDTPKLKSARFEFHNQDNATAARFEVRKFSVREVKPK